MHYDLLFISTFIDLKKIELLLNSLNNNLSIQLKVVLLAQRGLTLDVQKYQSAYNSIDLICTSEFYNSSKARNICIHYVLDSNLRSDFVMFPDDDSSFDENFFMKFREETITQKALVIDVYEFDSDVKYIKHNLRQGMKLGKKHYYAIGSTNIIIPYQIFIENGLFDELMGVGAKYGAAEDGDYYIRCCDIIDSFLYNSQLYNYHPKANVKYKDLSFPQLVKRFKVYGEGVVYMLCKNRMWGSAFYVCLRALMGTGYSLLHRDFKLSVVYFYSFYFRFKVFVKKFIFR